eukprot:TRINITY_DN114287_c0_g1_i1.p2 TRINITY_DN114287_c0_g1~~TRINITY_DN114287_c0_g1_i1.p2  ORF type:complete len:196 (+),score=24.57 TRINITY_DN114287_c0_g1_i1:48-635(+)
MAAGLLVTVDREAVPQWCTSQCNEADGRLKGHLYSMERRRKLSLPWFVVLLSLFPTVSADWSAKSVLAFLQGQQPTSSAGSVAPSPAVHDGHTIPIFGTADARAENIALRKSGYFRRGKHGESPKDVEDSEEYYGVSKIIWVVIADVIALGLYAALVRYVAQFAKKKQDENLQVPENVQYPAEGESYGAPRQTAF